MGGGVLVMLPAEATGGVRTGAVALAVPVADTVGGAGARALAVGDGSVVGVEVGTGVPVGEKRGAGSTAGKAIPGSGWIR